MHSKPKEACGACHDTNRAQHTHHIPRQFGDSTSQHHGPVRQFGDNGTCPQQMS